MILASILSAVFAILSGVVLVRTGSQPTADLAFIFMIIGAAAVAASAMWFVLARDEAKVPRATSAKIAIGLEGFAALAPPVLMALGVAVLVFSPLLAFLPFAALLLYPPRRHGREHLRHA